MLLPDALPEMSETEHDMFWALAATLDCDVAEERRVRAEIEIELAEFREQRLAKRAAAKAKREAKRARDNAA